MDQVYSHAIMERDELIQQLQETINQTRCSLSNLKAEYNRLRFTTNQERDKLKSLPRTVTSDVDARETIFTQKKLILLYISEIERLETAGKSLVRGYSTLHAEVNQLRSREKELEEELENVRSSTRDTNGDHIPSNLTRSISDISLGFLGSTGESFMHEMDALLDRNDASEVHMDEVRSQGMYSLPG